MGAILGGKPGGHHYVSSVSVPSHGARSRLRTGPTLVRSWASQECTVRVEQAQNCLVTPRIHSPGCVDKSWRWHPQTSRSGGKRTLSSHTHRGRFNPSSKGAALTSVHCVRCPVVTINIISQRC